MPYDEIVKGYEIAEGEYVVLEKEEIAAAAGARSRLLEVEEFVDADEIDPVVYDRTYYLGVRDAPDAYRLLHAALEQTGRAGIARWVFHNREYLVAIRALDGALAMHTMRFHDELVDPGTLDIAEPSRKPSDKEIEMAQALTETLREDFEPEMPDRHLPRGRPRLPRDEAPGQGAQAEEGRAARGERRPHGGAGGEPQGRRQALMPRPLWSGSLSFGLVNVPVQLVSAARDLDLHFRQLHDGMPVEMQRWCSKEGAEVPYEEIARSYEFEDGDTVIVTDDELDGLAPERTRTIEIDAFVDLAEIDPIYFDHPYLLRAGRRQRGRAAGVPAPPGGHVAHRPRGAREVRDAHEGVPGIVRARDGALSLTTMRMHDEVRPLSGVDTGKGARSRRSSWTPRSRSSRR